MGQVLNMIKGKAEQHDFLFDSPSCCSVNGSGDALRRGVGETGVWREERKKRLLKTFYFCAWKVWNIVKLVILEKCTAVLSECHKYLFFYYNQQKSSISTMFSNLLISTKLIWCLSVQSKEIKLGPNLHLLPSPTSFWHNQSFCWIRKEFKIYEDFMISPIMEYFHVIQHSIF